MRVGDRVTTTTALTTVDKPGSLEAYVYVPIERLRSSSRNLPVQIVDQSGKVIAGEPHQLHLAPGGFDDPDRAGQGADCERQ